MAINRNPRHSNGIHRRQYQSVTISDNQWQSVAISGNQWQSVAISDNQWQSVAISGTHSFTGRQELSPAVARVTGALDLGAHERHCAQLGGEGGMAHERQQQPVQVGEESAERIRLVY